MILARGGESRRSQGRLCLFFYSIDCKLLMYKGVTVGIIRDHLKNKLLVPLFYAYEGDRAYKRILGMVGRRR